jgi:hypothetical protein
MDKGKNFIAEYAGNKKLVIKEELSILDFGDYGDDEDFD